MQGFIPQSRGSFMLDLVAIAMFAILPAVVFGIHLVKNQGNYERHKKMMLAITLALAVTVVLFELEMRLVGWRQLAEPSPYVTSLMPIALGIHLLCSITTTALLIATVWLAFRRFPSPPRPSEHSPRHKTLGKLSAVGLMLTSVTGWIFYYLAFVAI